jgi:hypothetical protein
VQPPHLRLVPNNVAQQRVALHKPAEDIPSLLLLLHPATATAGARHCCCCLWRRCCSGLALPQLAGTLGHTAADAAARQQVGPAADAGIVTVDAAAAVLSTQSVQRPEAAIAADSAPGCKIRKTLDCRQGTDRAVGNAVLLLALLALLLLSNKRLTHEV